MHARRDVDLDGLHAGHDAAAATGGAGAVVHHARAAAGGAVVFGLHLQAAAGAVEGLFERHLDGMLEIFAPAGHRAAKAAHAPERVAAHAATGAHAAEHRSEEVAKAFEIGRAHV